MNTNLQAVKDNYTKFFKHGINEKELTDDYTKLNDPISIAIRENETNPIDMAEDLRFWQEFKDYFQFTKSNPGYADFLNIKKSIASFPPITSPGSIRRSYREYMGQLPKDVRENMQGIFNFAYDQFIRRKNIKPSSWSEVVSILDEHVGEIGNPAVTDFGFEKKILGDMSTFTE